MTKALRDHYATRATEIDKQLQEKSKLQKQKQQAELKGKLMDLAEEGQNQQSDSESMQEQIGLISKRRKLDDQVD